MTRQAGGMATCEENGVSWERLLRAIAKTTAALWKDWPRNMYAVGHDANGNFSLRGTCPYADCNRASVFVRVSVVSIGAHPGHAAHARWAAILQCQGCNKHILGLATQTANTYGYTYEEHFPIGSPSQEVADEIPEHIKDDFKEALRCSFVDAHNATAEMCRRALEASCLNLGASKGKVLEKMIDELEEKRVITPYLKEAAHNVRLGGNRGAHPLEDGPRPEDAPPPEEDAPVEKIEKEHAEAIIAFTREFFHHVYVGPKMLGKYNFTKPKARPESQA